MGQIDTTYGNITDDEADRLLRAARVTSEYPAGATEPWIANLLSALLKAGGYRTVLETGSFLGHTTVELCVTLQELGGGDLIACEIDPDRAETVQERLEHAHCPDVAWRVRQQDVLAVIDELPAQWLEFAFIDDDHHAEHVAEEIDRLFPKMAPGGLLCFHDVWGSCDLQRVVTAYGGIALDFPRTGPAGGLGVIQVAR